MFIRRGRFFSPINFWNKPSFFATLNDVNLVVHDDANSFFINSEYYSQLDQSIASIILNLKYSFDKGDAFFSCSNF